MKLSHHLIWLCLACVASRGQARETAEGCACQLGWLYTPPTTTAQPSLGSVGDFCTQHADCVANLYCSKGNYVSGGEYQECWSLDDCELYGDSIDGQCPAAVTVGASCNQHSDCGADMYCSKGTSSNGNEYQACNRLQRCDVQQDAIDGRCPGSPCTQHSHCGADEYCAKGLYSNGMEYQECDVLSNCYIYPDSIDGQCPAEVCPPTPCVHGCCNPDEDPNGDWCFVQDETCQGSGWGYCSPDMTDYSKCGTKGVDSTPWERVVNGQDVSECEYPWQVSFRRASGHHFCGGSIISPDWVLTAAHCVECSTDDTDTCPGPVCSVQDGSGPSSSYPCLCGVNTCASGFCTSSQHSCGEGNGTWDAQGTGSYVVVGDYNKKSSCGDEFEQRHEVAEIVIHPGWNPLNLDFDVALIRLRTPVRYNKCARPVCLPDMAESDVAAGTDCYVSGWGTLNEDGPSPDIMQEGEITILPIQDGECRRNTLLRPFHLCGAGRWNDGNTVVDACQGDSGGPLVCKNSAGDWVQNGVVSYGIGCARKQYPGIYASVHYVMPWLCQKTDICSHTCEDSTTFTDPVYGDSCAGWVAYPCYGQPGMTQTQEEELRKQCPVACKLCDGVPMAMPTTTTRCYTDSTTFIDPVYGDTCAGWVGYACTEASGLTAAQAEELQRECPVACFRLPACPSTPEPTPEPEPEPEPEQNCVPLSIPNMQDLKRRSLFVMDSECDSKKD